jgi:hypothetical protein
VVVPAVCGFVGDINIWFLAEQVARPVPDDAVVVGDHHADRHTGTRTVSAAPRPGIGGQHLRWVVTDARCLTIWSAASGRSSDAHPSANLAPPAPR